MMIQIKTSILLLLLNKIILFGILQEGRGGREEGRRRGEGGDEGSRGHSTSDEGEMLHHIIAALLGGPT